MTSDTFVAARSMAQQIANAWIENGYEREVHQRMNGDGQLRQLLVYMDIFTRPRDVKRLSRLALDISMIAPEAPHVQDHMSKFLNRQTGAYKALRRLSESDVYGVYCGAARAVLLLAKGEWTAAFLSIREFVEE